MALRDLLLEEIAQEARSLRAMLARLPADQLGWQPHEKSMTLGRLAGHIAEIPQWSDSILRQDELDLAGMEYNPFEPATADEATAAFDRHVEAMNTVIGEQDDDQMAEQWTFRFGEQMISQTSRWAALRIWVINHMVHHRGQLSVYLRQLEVPLPPVYGPTADDQSFG